MFVFIIFILCVSVQWNQIELLKNESVCVCVCVCVCVYVCVERTKAHPTRPINVHDMYT